jgi:hypothetical protein
LNIDWRVKDPVVSEKDLAAPYLSSIEKDYVFSNKGATGTR